MVRASREEPWLVGVELAVKDTLCGSGGAVSDVAEQRVLDLWTGPLRERTWKSTTWCPRKILTGTISGLVIRSEYTMPWNTYMKQESPGRYVSGIVQLSHQTAHSEQNRQTISAIAPCLADCGVGSHLQGKTCAGYWRTWTVPSSEDVANKGYER